MNTNRDNATNRVPITWTRKKEWGSEGLTHRATVTVAGDEWKFRLVSPRKGQWRAMGSHSGPKGFYAEARTVADAKALVQARVDQLTAEAETDIVGVLPSGRTITLSHKTDDDRLCGPGTLVIPDRLPEGRQTTACGTCKGSGADPEDPGDYDGTVHMHNPHTAEPCPSCDGLGRELLDGVPESVAVVLSPQQAGILAVLDGNEPTPEQQAAMNAASQRVGEFFRAVTRAVGEMAPAVTHAARQFQRLAFALSDRCDCPTPSHRMSCGEGGRVRVTQGGAA